MRKLYESAARLQSHFKQLKIKTAIIGGIAVIVWGIPRFTRDADLKLLLSRDDSARLLSSLPPNYEVTSADPEKNIRKFGLVFVRDENGIRLDLGVADTPFDIKVIERAKSIRVEPRLNLTVCSAEDLIIYKLISTRARDWQDVETVIDHQGDLLDDAYILDWLRQFEQALDDSTLVSTYRRMRGK